MAKAIFLLQPNQEIPASDLTYSTGKMVTVKVDVIQKGKTVRVDQEVEEFKGGYTLIEQTKAGNKVWIEASDEKMKELKNQYKCLEDVTE